MPIRQSELWQLLHNIEAGNISAPNYPGRL
jgi:hypothetical protein